MAWDKSVSQKDAVKSFLVYEDGKVNLEASVSKYRSAALTHLVKEESDEKLITECMTELFDQFRGANLNADFVKSQTVQKMAKRIPELSNPNLFSILSAKVEAVLHENCDQPETPAKGDKPAVAAITGRTYGMRKGAGGGFYRVADRPATK